jgi:hypothetical protein
MDVSTVLHSTEHYSAPIYSGIAHHASGNFPDCQLAIGFA